MVSTANLLLVALLIIIEAINMALGFSMCRVRVVLTIVLRARSLWLARKLSLKRPGAMTLVPGIIWLCTNLGTFGCMKKFWFMLFTIGL